MNATDKAIRDNFPGPINAGIRKLIRDSINAGNGVPSLSNVALTANGRAGLAAIKAAYDSEKVPA